MKSFIDFLTEDDKLIKDFIAEWSKQLDESDAPANTTAGVAQADAQPFKTGKIAGCDYVEVDFDTYNNCKFGKKPYARWDKYVQDEPLRKFIQAEFSKSKSLMVVNKETTAATYLRR